MGQKKRTKRGFIEAVQKASALIKKAQAANPRTKNLALVSLRSTKAKQAEADGRDWLDYIHQLNHEALTVDGFESCIIGVATRFGAKPIVAYDTDKCLSLLMTRDGMSYEEAEFNVAGAWMGEGTPIFVSTVPL